MTATVYQLLHKARPEEFGPNGEFLEPRKPKVPEPFRVPEDTTPYQFFLLAMVSDAVPIAERVRCALAAAKISRHEGLPAVFDGDLLETAPALGLDLCNYVPIRAPATKDEEILWSRGIAPRR